MTFRLISGLAAAVLGLAAPAAAQVVNVYNWAEYTAPDTVPGFESATGIKVRYDVYDNNDTLQAKLLTGNSGYDIVVPSTHYAARQREGGLFQKLDKSLIPNWKNLDPDLMELVAQVDPGNEYFVPWGYVTNGLGYNLTRVKELAGEDAPIHSWDMLLDPANASKLQSCGISILDEASQVFPAVLHHMGRDPNSTKQQDYRDALEVLKKIRPYVRQFSSSGYIDELAVGDLCMVFGFSGDVIIAKRRAEESNRNYEIDYVIPEGGAPAAFDVMAIPKDARNVKEAHAFINYIETPEVHAAITNAVFFPSANAAAKEFVEPWVAEHPMLYPPPEVARQLFMIQPQAPAIQRLQSRLWAELKSGR